MILQRLAEYYDRLAANPSTASRMARPGHSWQKISFCAVLNRDGTLNSFQSLLQPQGKRLVPRKLLVPGATKPSGPGLNPGLLWDSSVYLLGFKKEDSKPERTRASFEAFRNRHLELESRVNHPSFSAVCSFLRAWSEEKAGQHATELEQITQSFGVFRVASELRFVHDEVHVPGAAAADEVLGQCLITGATDVPIARLHEPKIKGVKDAQSAGALLVSFNEDAYESFRKAQSYNAPVSQNAVFRYANALNHLVGENERRFILGDATVVFWADKPTIIDDLLRNLFGRDMTFNSESTSPEDVERVSQVRLLLTQLRDGTAYGGLDDENDGSAFFVLGLSPNNSRLSVRFWAEISVGAMKQRLAKHLRALALYDSREEWPPSLRQIVASTGRAEIQNGRFKGFVTDNISPLLAGALARAVLSGGSYPEALLANLITRIRADGEIHYHRCSAIKACLVRNSRLRGNPKEVSVALDLNQSDPAYNAGRLFALLEKIQTDSVDGELNATIKDRYFSSASSTPAVVFPRLVRLSQFHMAKLSTGTKIYYEKQLGEVMSKLNSFPRYLPLEDQGQFVIGYFHQRQDLFKSKKPESQGESQ